MVPPTFSRRAAAVVAVAVLAAIAPHPGIAPAQEAPARGAEDRAADRDAIRAVLKSFVAALESGDAKAVAAHWTDEGEFIADEGRTFRGREALERAYAGLFARSPKVRAKLEADSLRFVARDAAIEEGTATVRRDPGEPAVTARYSALLAREDGRWRLAVLREWPEEGTSIRDLAWLVGTWQPAGDGAAEDRTTYEWDENKAFLRVRFGLQAKERALGGTQMIGKDPATGRLRAWTFGAEGGIGEATWTRDGDRWIVEATGTLADGSTMAATNILTRIDDNTFTWHSTRRRLDDEELPDLPPVKVTRVRRSNDTPGERRPQR